ncbi:MAG: TonB-dependent receptor plug domain-containing protein [Gammaproteobacteria bacterium]
MLEKIWGIFMRTSFILVIGIVSINNLYAEEVIITVKERGTGVAIEGAYVIINDEKYVENTDAHGKAKIPLLENNDTIKIVASGYDDLIHAYNDSSLVFYLYPEVVEGEGLEVTEQRIPEKVSKISLSKEELISAPGSLGDPLKVITSLPGIVETSELSSEVYMRGSDANDNIVWVNRAPVGYLYHLGGFHSTISPSLVDDLNVFLGGFPVEYGDKLGGVIDVKLRAPRTDRQHYKFDISTISTSVLAEGPVGENSEDSYYAAFRRSYIDLLFSPSAFNEQFADGEPDADKVTTVPRYYDGQFLYRHKLEQGYIDSYFFTASDKVGAELIGSAKADPDLAGALSASQKFQTAGITLMKPWSISTDFIMPLALYHSENYFQIGSDSTTGEPFFVDSEVNTLFWQPEMQWRVSKNAQLNYGVSMNFSQAPVNLYISRPPSENDVDFILTDQPKYRINKDIYYNAIAPYIKHRKQWSKSWATIAGLRYSDIRLRDGFEAQEVSPRATVEYQVNKSALLTATWGKYVQTPEITQVLQDYANPYLEITKAEHRIIGLEYQLNPLYSIKTEIYDKPMKNLVVAVDENAPPNNYSNEGEGRAYGIDIFIKRRAEHRRLGWLALSLSKSERTDLRTGETRPFSGDLPFVVTAVWGQPFSGSWNRWDWSVKAKLTSGTTYTPVTGRHRAIAGDDTSRWVGEYGEFNSARTPTYFKLDLRIGKTVLFEESTLKFYFDIQNVTFRENITEYDYGNEFENISNPKEVVGTGFFPFFGVEIDM